MNSKQKRKELRRYERLYNRVRIAYKETLEGIMDHLERYPKSVVMVQIQAQIDQASVPFREAIETAIRGRGK
jgi:hypothetical protein